MRSRVRVPSSAPRRGKFRDFKALAKARAFSCSTAAPFPRRTHFANAPFEFSGGPILSASILYQRHTSEQSLLCSVFLCKKTPPARWFCCAYLPLAKRFAFRASGILFPTRPATPPQGAFSPRYARIHLVGSCGVLSSGGCMIRFKRPGILGVQTRRRWNFCGAKAGLPFKN